MQNFKIAMFQIMEPVPKLAFARIVDGKPELTFNPLLAKKFHNTQQVQKTLGRGMNGVYATVLDFRNLAQLELFNSKLSEFQTTFFAKNLNNQ